MTAPARREPLSRDRIVAAAVDLVDEQGLDALTLRRVASRLGVTPMPLYRHVANGDELVDLVVEALLEREALQLPLPLEWDELLEQVAWQTRRILLRHPAVYDALRRRALMTTTARQGMEGLLESFARAGLSPSAAVSAYASVLMPVLGNVALLHGRGERMVADGRTEGEERARIADVLTGLDPAEYPRLRQAGAEFANMLDEDVFRWGLDVVLEGLRAKLAPRRRRGSGTRQLKP